MNATLKVVQAWILLKSFLPSSQMTIPTLGASSVDEEKAILLAIGNILSFCLFTLNDAGYRLFSGYLVVIVEIELYNGRCFYTPSFRIWMCAVLRHIGVVDVDDLIYFSLFLFLILLHIHPAIWI